MCYMFEGCSSLNNLNLSNFNTQNVTNMWYMFYGCSSLKNLNLSNFNTQNLTNINCMFNGCESLTNVNLSNFNTQKVHDSNMFWIFYGRSSLKKQNVITNDKRILKDLKDFN